MRLLFGHVIGPPWSAMDEAYAATFVPASKARGGLVRRQDGSRLSSLPTSLVGRTVLQIIPQLDAGGAERTTIDVAAALHIAMDLLHEQGLRAEGRHPEQLAALRAEADREADREERSPALQSIGKRERDIRVNLACARVLLIIQLGEHLIANIYEVSISRF
jgi:hypothetical protein